MWKRCNTCGCLNHDVKKTKCLQRVDIVYTCRNCRAEEVETYYQGELLKRCYIDGQITE